MGCFTETQLNFIDFFFSFSFYRFSFVNHIFNTILFTININREFFIFFIHNLHFLVVLFHGYRSAIKKFPIFFTIKIINQLSFYFEYKVRNLFPKILYREVKKLIISKSKGHLTIIYISDTLIRINWFKCCFYNRF